MLTNLRKNFFNPSPVFGQLVALVRQANIESVIRKAKADKYAKKFKTKDQTEFNTCYF